MCSINAFIGNHDIDMILNKYIVHRSHEHEEKVRDACMLVFDGLSTLSQVLDPSDRMLLSSAAMLHDIGYFINKRNHEIHSSYIIQNERLLDGIPTCMRNELSFLCRYHRKNESVSTEAMKPARANSLLGLLSILRLADAVSDKHVKDICLDVSGMTPTLVLHMKLQEEDDGLEKFMHKLEQKSILSTNMFQMKTRFKNPA